MKPEHAARRAEIRRLLAEGSSFEQIAAKIGSTSENVRRLVSKMEADGYLTPRPKRVTLIDRTLEMVNAGRTLREICDATGASEESVSRAVYELRRRGSIAKAVCYAPGTKAKKHGSKVIRGNRPQDLIARAMIAAKTATTGKDIPADMLAQIASFRGPVTKCPTRYADGSEEFRAARMVVEAA
ncbi:hypothetical protein ACJ41P_10420 [Azospirillum argentinense]|uniref:Uncharacterized protein n=1 Tax=Azospirillum argentinense TaxID=2970906 RepID=A0ABW8V4V9_9PROT